MEVTVSTKYQIVIPKVVRRQLGIKPGQKVIVSDVKKDGSVSLSRPLTGQEIFEKYAGTLKTSETAWGKAGMDAAEWIRRQRDES